MTHPSGIERKHPGWVRAACRAEGGSTDGSKDYNKGSSLLADQMKGRLNYDYEGQQSRIADQIPGVYDKRGPVGGTGPGGGTGR